MAIKHLNYTAQHPAVLLPLLWGNGDRSQCPAPKAGLAGLLSHCWLPDSHKTTAAALWGWGKAAREDLEGFCFAPLGLYSPHLARARNLRVLADTKLNINQQHALCQPHSRHSITSCSSKVIVLSVVHCCSLTLRAVRVQDFKVLRIAI